MESYVKVSEFAENQAGCPPEEGYGIELEAEGYDTEANRRLDSRSLSKHWTITEDGSLRNGGVEFVSRFLRPETLEQAVRHLYARTRKKWHPSIRTGVHVHCNMLGRTMEELRRVLAYYAFCEPVLFHLAGEHREENIYCVPWYRAPDEADNAVRGVLKHWLSFNDACKYSALYTGPLRTFGTIEFRHAHTFDGPDQMLGWLLLVRAIANSWQYSDPIELYAEGGTEAVLEAVFGSELLDTLGLPMDKAVELVNSVGADEVALRFQPCTYKLGEWGKPGEFVVEGNFIPDRSSIRLHGARADGIDRRELDPPEFQEDPEEDIEEAPEEEQ